MRTNFYKDVFKTLSYICHKAPGAVLQKQLISYLWLEINLSASHNLKMTKYLKWSDCYDVFNFRSSLYENSFLWKHNLKNSHCSNCLLVTCKSQDQSFWKKNRNTFCNKVPCSTKTKLYFSCKIHWFLFHISSIIFSGQFNYMCAIMRK